MRSKSRLPLAFSIPKSEDCRNEDQFYRSGKGVYALSDGASVSFDSASWARILVRRYTRNPEFTREWLSAAIAEFRKLYDRDSLPWMQQASFDKGSFASLLGIRVVDQGRLIQVLSIGDSLAVLCDGDCIKATFPFTAAAAFNRSPQLLCTNPAENVFLNGADLGRDRLADWTFRGLKQPALLCMTDALGHWLLSHRDRNPSPISVLRKVRTPKAFARFVQEERAMRRMKRDDTTLIALW
ncbi:MAG TPA: hypothetical protein VEK55_07360 [Xanthobacteraceae bacterium]|nr:hypothetical protein [Xanthobacteraceae bacterium]